MAWAVVLRPSTAARLTLKARITPGSSSRSAEMAPSNGGGYSAAMRSGAGAAAALALRLEKAITPSSILPKRKARRSRA